uniref:Glycosyltransferase n=1 Tax=Curcuma alismatifolia TaxID=251764 RepID=A0A7T3PM14_9LILI|nr:anthocyanin 3'-O-beta-glucosyltransferase 1 [Curcuma alismatifolia]
MLNTMADDLQILFLPFLSPGHIIPMVDLARLFAGRGIKATVVTTTGNVPLVKPTVDLANTDASLRHPIQLLPLRLPCSEAGIPEGYENLADFPESDPDDFFRFIAATERLEPSFSLVLKTHRPDCVVVDFFYPWATRVAQDASVPSLLFNGSNFFSSAVIKIVQDGELKQGDLETERLIEVPGIPQKIRLKLSNLPYNVLHPNQFSHRMAESLHRIHGTVVNSFYELERDYVDRAPNSRDVRFWFVGPVSLQNRDMDTKMVRGSGDAASGSADHFLSWLETKRPRSVLYVCFGSMAWFTATQLREIARGLEASDRPFIWVVRNAGETSEWLPEGFESRVVGGGKGMLVQGWAPQLLILNHEAVGGFVTHCGWNSCLEAIAAGVPVITWPLFAEQFLNEELLVNVHKMGISIGVLSSCDKAEERTVVNGEQLKAAVDELMGSGEEAEERRKRARELGQTARRAMEEGGSSHEAMTCLIDELIRLKTTVD